MGIFTCKVSFIPQMLQRPILYTVKGYVCDSTLNPTSLLLRTKAGNKEVPATILFNPFLMFYQGLVTLHFFLRSAALEVSLWFQFQVPVPSLIFYCFQQFFPLCHGFKFSYFSDLYKIPVCNSFLNLLVGFRRFTGTKGENADFIFPISN